MSSRPEFTTFEAPYIDQLIGIGWKVVTGNLDHPSVTGRETLREILIKADLRTAIERINLLDGKPWIDDASIVQAVSAPEVAEVRRRPVMHCGLVENLLGRRVQMTAFRTESSA
ncbi:MAG: hypothetical protein ACREBE_00095 [bacterium]